MPNNPMLNLKSILARFLLSSCVLYGVHAFGAEDKQVAIFAGGCFWCMQPPYDQLKAKGVLNTRVGYAGGSKADPTYEQVSAGNSGHREVIEVTYDAKKISFKELLSVFWKNIDPYDAKGQFCDKGEQYTSAVYIMNDQQKKDFDASLVALEKDNIKVKDVATQAIQASKFYPAEEYHQAYYEKNPIRYKFYRGQCGRDKRLKQVWGVSAH
jgi:peptide-methionine (S)-S-oxide reductase